MKKQLSESIMKTFVGKVLQQFDNFSLDRYLYDFVHLIPVSAKTIPNVQQKYYEVCCDNLCIQIILFNCLLLALISITACFG